MNSGTSDFLNASRWLAAFFVIFGHVYKISNAEDHNAAHSNLLLHAAHFFSGFGHIAVIVFFVISGFLVGGRAILIFRDKGFNAIDYFVNRFSRIYTVLLPALIIGGILDWSGVRFFNFSGIYTHPDQFYTNPFGNNIAKHLNFGIFAGNLVQLQTIIVSSLGSNGPLWSLANEWWYYVLFGFCMIVYRPGPMVTRLLAGGVVVTMVAVLPSTISLWFVIWGIGAGLAVLDRYWAGWPFLAGAALAAVCLIAVRWTDAGLVGETTDVATDFAMDLAVALGFSAALICAKNLKRPLKFGSLQRHLASFSYTVYLVHFPAMVFVVAVMKDVLDVEFLRQPGVGTLIYAAALLAILYVYAWVFAAFTEAHTDVVRSRLSWVIPALLHQASFLDRVRLSRDGEASSGQTLAPDQRVEVALGSPPPISLR
jgi:peptidoglycan/LPS O-acetylase OafA/YrhL